MNLRLVSPRISVGVVLLIGIGLLFQVIRIFVASTTVLEIAGGVLAAGFVIGTARYYYRIGVAAAVVSASLEGAVALMATGSAMLTESMFDCGLGSRLFMYVCGLTVFAVVSTVGSRFARRGLGEDEEIAARLGFIGQWSESAAFRALAFIWGCLSAYVLTFFLLGATVGPWIVVDTPAFTPIWTVLTTVAGDVGAVPPIGNDTAEALVRIIGTPNTGPSFCAAR